jgi:hypothetical protein
MISYDEQIYKKKYFKYKMKYLSLKGGENSKPSSRSPSKPSSTSPSKPSSTNIEPTIKIVKDNEIIYTNGDIYNGEIKDDKANGKGKKIYKNGDIYEGEFLNDELHGKGKKIYQNGDIYVGEFKNDKLHGKGILTQKNAKYVGEWEKGYMNGYIKRYGNIGIEKKNNSIIWELFSENKYSMGKEIVNTQKKERRYHEF